MSVPVRKPCNACVTLYWFQDASSFPLYRFAVFSHLVSAASNATTLAFHFKIIAFNKIFPTLISRQTLPLRAVFSRWTLNYVQSTALRKKRSTRSLFSIRFTIIFQLKTPSALVKTSEKRFETWKLVCHWLVMLNIRPELQQEACTLNNDYGMKFSADYVCFTRND